MRALVTGSNGLVGSEVVRLLTDRGVEVVPFDVADGLDILDESSLESAMAGCDAVVHSAALLEAPADRPERLLRVNVDGTSNVHLAAEALGTRRVVFLSSVSVLGVFKGHRRPDYLPLDLDHPCYPSTEYEESKLEAERLCSEIARGGRVSVVSLRPPGVWRPETYKAIHRARQADPMYEWQPYWEYGAFLDVRDLAEACWAGVCAELEGHVVLMVASSDISTSGRSTLEWVQAIHPDIEWRGDDAFVDQPYRTLIGIGEARQVLGWEPRFTWKAFVDSTSNVAAS